jgi:hypothetical protein
MTAPETRRLLTRLDRRPSLAYRVAIAVALIVLATLARLWLEREFSITLTFITFFPAITLISP